MREVGLRADPVSRPRPCYTADWRPTTTTMA